MSRKGGAGFTLLELLITLAVITVLGMIAVTSYSQYTIRAKRTDATAALVRLAQKQERYYSAHRRYLCNDDNLPTNCDDKIECSSLMEDALSGDQNKCRCDQKGVDNRFDIEALGFPKQLTEREYYRLSIQVGPKENCYLLTAVPVEGGPQARDETCGRFFLDHTGKEAAVKADGTLDSSNTCWGR